jgi:signal transduction histidine kinase
MEKPAPAFGIVSCVVSRCCPGKKGLAFAIPWQRIYVMTGSESKSRRQLERLVASPAIAKPHGPATNPPPKTEAAPDGLSFAKVPHNCLASGVILIDGKKKVTSLNSEAKHLLGLSPDQATLPALASLPAALQAMVSETLASGESPAGRQVELKTASRGPITLHLSAVPVQAGQKNSGVVLVLNDLTRARQVEQHIQQLDRLASLGTLAAGMAHEIKNALVPAKTFVDLLLEKHQDAELVEVVRREIGRIDALVSRMLKFAGPGRPAFREVRLHEILEHSLRLLQPQLEHKLVSVNGSFLASNDALHGDDYQLQQAFVNLFLNALEAMGPNDTLSVTTDLLPPGAAPASPPDTADRAHLRLTIKDTGIGIPPENLARLFEPFFTTKPNGTGLGLLITQRIIREHHGTITVQSEPNKGTTFQILLPALA